MGEKARLVGGVALSAVVGVLLMPILARAYPASEFAAISLVLVINGLLGTSDALRPSVVTLASRVGSSLSWMDCASVSLAFGLLSGGVTLAVILVSIKDYFGSVDALQIALGTVFFVQYATVGGFLDSNGHVGTAALLRACGNALLYICLAMAPLLSDRPSIASIFAGVQLVLLFSFFGLASPYLNLRSGASFRWNWELFGRGVQTLQQNFAKVVIDAADRFLLAASGSAVAIAAYNSCYELASRLNIPSQLFATFLFPRLCKGEASLSRVLDLGLALSLMLLIGSALIWPISQSLLGWYLGPQFKSYGFVLVGLFVVSSGYCLAFFSQSALRAMDKYKYLSRTFIFSAATGLALLVPMYRAFDLKGLIIVASILKSPGYLGYFYLLKSGVCQRAWKRLMVLGLHCLGMLFVLAMILST